MAMALIIALPLMGLIAYDIRNDFRKSQEHAESISFQFSRLTAGQAGNALRQGKKTLIGLAQIPEVRTLDPRKCSSLLRELNDLLEQYANVITRDATGALVCSAVPPGSGERSRPASDYDLEEVLRTGGFVVGKPVRGNITGKWVATIAIGDFGTGYSSLSYIARLPINALKIDRSFIVDMPSSPDCMSIVQSVVSLAHSLSLKVIAEGVDAEEQVKLLRLLRCDEVQGFHFSQPLSLEKASQFLQKRM